MLSCRLYIAPVQSFTSHELVQTPDTLPWSEGCMTFYVDSMQKFFIVFVRDADLEPSLPVVTGWVKNFDYHTNNTWVLDTPTEILRNDGDDMWRDMVLIIGRCGHLFRVDGLALLCRCSGTPFRAPPFFPMLFNLKTQPPHFQH